MWIPVIGLLIFIACSPKSNPSKTVRTNYTADILPLLQAKCTPCHLPSKGGFKANFENYNDTQKYGPQMPARIKLNPGDKGFMPFKHAKLSEAEITVFEKWVKEGLTE